VKGGGDAMKVKSGGVKGGSEGRVKGGDGRE
jgi:hypothetical protein